MESMNKFKVLTVVVICLFIFVVAAIYSNTKDASARKEQQKVSQQSPDKEIKEIEYADDDFASLVKKVDILTKKTDDLTTRINNSEAGENVVKCKILGTLTDDGVEEASPNNAVQDAKDSGVPLVITCRL